MPSNNGSTAAQRCLGACVTALAGEEPAGVSTASVEVGSLKVTVTIVPLADVKRPGAEYTPCELAVLTVVAESSTPLTRVRILEELERRCQTFGDSTVGRSLARLVKAGKLASCRHPPLGYCLLTSAH